MTLLAPLLLLAGIAVAVPLWLHLHRSRDPGTHTFPAIRYLLRSVEEEGRSTRFRELLLLLVRCAIVVVLVLAGARLVLPVGGGFHPPAQVVVVVDNGIHSSAIAEGETLLDHLVRLGEPMLATLGPLDQVRIVAAGEPWRPALPLAPDDAVEALRGLESTAVLPRLAESVARADALLDALPEGPRRIVVLTTGVDATLADAPTPEAPTSPVLLVDPGVAVPENRGIALVDLGDGLVPRAGEPAPLTVTLAGHDIAGIAVRIRIDDELVGVGRTDEAGQFRLVLPPFAEGSFAGTAEIDPDALRADDQRPFVVRIRTVPRVATPDPLHPFLDEALETLHAAGRIIRVSGDAEVTLHTASDLPPGRPGVVRILLPPGDPARLPAFNRTLENLNLPWRVEVGSGEGRTPLQVASGFPDGLREVEVTDRLMLTGPEGSPGVELRTGAGHPWLVRGEAPDGSPIRLLGSPLDPDFTDLPLSAAMIPFLDRILTPPVAGEGSPEGGHGHRAGVPFELPPGAVTVRHPDGRRIPVEGLRRFHETGTTGLYEVLNVDGEPVATVAVQVPAAAMERGTAVELATLAARWPSGVRAADPSVVGTDPFGGERRGREVSTALLLGALVLLVVEGVLARAGAAKGAASVSLSSPPEPGAAHGRRS